MISNLLILGGIFFIGHRNWRKQKHRYRRKMLCKQQERTHYLRGKPRDKLSTEIGSDDKGRTTKELTSLIIAMGCSVIGLWLYPPFYFVAPLFILFALRRRFVMAWQALKKRELDLGVLQAISITGAIAGQYFFIVSLLSFITVLGEILTARVTRKSHHQITDIYQDMPKTVWLLQDGIEHEVALAEIQAGDTVIVSAGETIPADGKIIKGVAGIDEHRFTGESEPVKKAEGDNVYAMTLILSGKIYLEIAQAGKETSAMKIAEILDQTSDYKSSTVLESEAISHQLVTPALIMAGLALPLAGLNSAVGILYAHPKERLKVAAPLSLLRYIKQAMDEGILIKDGRSLELLNQVDTIVFDKTGTLTEVQPRIGAVHTFSLYTEDDILRFAAIAEYKQNHPLALTISSEAERRRLDIPKPEYSECNLGYGVKAKIGEATIVVGSMRYIHLEKILISASIANQQKVAQEESDGIIWVAKDQELIGSIKLLPTLRPEVKWVVNTLKKLNNIKQTYILSGDMEEPTARLAKDLHIDHYFAQILPVQKAKIIEKIQRQGGFVCYIGDGMNDSIAMKQAQVSISLNGASRLATDTAQILLLDQGLTHLPRLFKLAQGFNKHMRAQFTMILLPSAFGVGAIVLLGMGMSGMMILSMVSLTASISYAIFDKPKPR